MNNLNITTDNYKIEIIDNLISNCYEFKLYRLKDVSKWYQSERFDWVWEWGHSLGKKYMCPEIYRKKITIEELFDREVKLAMKDKNITEVHKIVVTKN